MDLKPNITQALQDGHQLLGDFLRDSQNIEAMEAMARGLAECFQSDKAVLCCGNGGSAADALHFAEEFTGNFRQNRRALPVISLLEPTHLTCVANDYGFESIFKRGVEAYAKQAGALVALSTSGNSKNIIAAVDAAESAGLDVYLLLGGKGGALKGRGTHELLVPAFTSDRVQEIHMLCLHVLIETVERILFPENYS